MCIRDRGKGTAIDAAKYFRETGIKPEDLAAKGISLTEGLTQQGLALSHLNDRLFDDVVQGKMKMGRAVVIGEATADADAQDAIMAAIERKEKSGKTVTNDAVAEMARRANAAGTHTAVSYTHLDVYKRQD